MNRRDFLKRAGAVVATAAAVPALVDANEWTEADRIAFVGDRWTEVDQMNADLMYEPFFNDARGIPA